MAQSQHILSKAQEQLNYATSRCGTLMEQLGRIKSHVNWRQKVQENLNEENLDDEKRDDTRSKGKIKTYNGESKESNLIDMAQEIDENKINYKKKNKKEELSDEEKKHDILSPASSCFVSLTSSENSSSVTIPSEEELEEENEEEEEIKVHDEKKENREKEKYKSFKTEASKEKEWETDETQDSEAIDDEDDNEYETEEEEVIEPFNEGRKGNKNTIYRNFIEKKHGKRDKKIENQNKTKGIESQNKTKGIESQNNTSFYIEKDLDILSTDSESVSEGNLESYHSSDYITTDLEEVEEEEINKVEKKLKVERKEQFDQKIELMKKDSKEEELQKITSPLKVNLFTEELATEFIPVTQDLDKDIEIIEINANDFNQISNNNLIEKDTDTNGNKDSIQVEQKNVQNKTKSKNKTDKIEKRPTSSQKEDISKNNVVKKFNKTINLSQEQNSKTERHVKPVSANSNKKLKKPTLPVIMENEVTRNQKKEILVNNSKIKKRNQLESLFEEKIDSKEEKGKRTSDKKDIIKVSKQENIKISDKKSTVNISNVKDQTKRLNVFERLSLNIKKTENVKNTPTTTMKSIQQIKKNDSIKNKIFDEKFLQDKSTKSKILKPPKKVASRKSSEDVITRSLFESIQNTIRQNLNLKEQNMMLVTEKHKEEELSGENNNQVIPINSVGNKQNKTVNRSNTANPDLQKNKNQDVNYQESDKDIKKSTTAIQAQGKVNKPVHVSKFQNKSKNIFNEKRNNEIEVDNGQKFMKSDLVKDRKQEETLQQSVGLDNEIFQNWINIKNKLFKTESERNVNLLRTPQNSKTETENRSGSKFKLKSWEENSDFGKTIVRQTKAVMPHYGPGANMNYNAYNNYSNIKIANSLGFNTIPFIVGQSTSKSYHIGLNIQQTLSLMNLSPSVPTLRIGIENKNSTDSEKDSIIASQTTAMYKPKSCPACTAKPQDIKDEDEDIIILEDPWHVPQKDMWDQQNIASRKSSRCTCLPTNIISFNEVLTQMFQAEGLMPSRPLSSTNLTHDSRQDYGKYEQENKKQIVRANNATYLTRLLRNIQRIQNQYIVPITKLSINGFKNNTP